MEPGSKDNQPTKEEIARKLGSKTVQTGVPVSKEIQKILKNDPDKMDSYLDGAANEQIKNNDRDIGK